MYTRKDDMRLLVIEDEEIMANALAQGLKRAGYAVDVASDGRQGLDLAEVNRYDVVILDRDLPVLHGDEVCRRLVATGRECRILMLTAAARLEERVAGFTLGSDDYLAKPFAFSELLARINALVRRPAYGSRPVLRSAGVTIDTMKRSVTREGRQLELTNKEYGLLVELVRADGGVLSAEDLFERVWNENADPFSNAVRVTMVGLRKKLGEPQVIETHRGAGYRIRP
jgi:DNA-binding response OmpR family regulator